MCFSCTSLTDLPCSRTHQSGRHSSKARTAGWETQPGLGVGGNTNEWEILTNLLDLGSTAGHHPNRLLCSECPALGLSRDTIGAGPELAVRGRRGKLRFSPAKGQRGQNPAGHGPSRWQTLIGLRGPSELVRRWAPMTPSSQGMPGVKQTHETEARTGRSVWKRVG